MRTRSARGLGLALTLPLWLTAHARDALACGGFFCASQPVIQTGEQIIFGVDPDAQSVDAIINIAYQGAAPDFAWLLPLTAAPRSIRAGSSAAFRALAISTTPRFQPRLRTEGSCSVGLFGVGADAGAALDAGAPSGGVTVLSQESVGPYDSVVLASRDPTATRGWLNDNGYRVTDEMMQVVVPYLATDHVLLALKLRKEQTVGDLQPIQLELDAIEPCIPLRLTAIAAQADMDVVAYVLGPRRAIPRNYFHVIPNWARIDWLRNGANYRSIVAEAADEAGGNAFVTEFSGATSSLGTLLDTQGNERVRRELEGAASLGAFLSVVTTSGLFQRPETLGILRRWIPDALLESAGLDPALFWQAPPFYAEQLQETPFDPLPPAREIDERIFAPDLAAQALFGEFPHLTRLYTLISPEEMNVDPMFDFRDLPDVSNVHGADVLVSCEDGRPTRAEVTLDDGQRYALSANLQPLASTPAAAKIEDLARALVISDRSDDIAVVLDGTFTERRGELPDPRGSSCGCRTGATRDAAGSALALLIGILISRRRRG